MSGVLWPPRVRTILASLGLFVLLLPLAAIYLARIYENQLVRETEKILLAEAVLVGEILRARVDPGAKAPVAPPPAPDAEFHPFTASLDLRTSKVLPAAAREPAGVKTSSLSQDLEALLERATLRNLSGVRVLDRTGVVIASPRHERGYSLAHLPEVQAALAGDYRPALRERRSDEKAPPLSSLSRAAAVRVSIAIPVFEDPYAAIGQHRPVLGAIYVARTPLDLEKALWLIRGELAWPLAVVLGLTVLVVAGLSLILARPLTRLRADAERVARGDPGVSLAVRGFAPEEVHALALALGAMRAKLEAKARYVQEFAANTAHELKTPLTSLIGASELLLDSPMDPARARRFLENMHADARRMDVLVGRILELARIEAVPAQKTSIALAPLLEGLAQRWGRRAVEVVPSVDPALTVEADPELLLTALDALLENAARHGRGQPVELIATHGTDGVQIAVRDHGPQLPEGHFTQAFQRFYTTERDRGGTGLGLSIVRAVAEAHGGRAQATVRPEGGAEVLLWFPAPLSHKVR